MYWRTTTRFVPTSHHLAMVQYLHMWRAPVLLHMLCTYFQTTPTAAAGWIHSFGHIVRLNKLVANDGRTAVSRKKKCELIKQKAWTSARSLHRSSVHQHSALITNLKLLRRANFLRPCDPPALQHTTHSRPRTGSGICVYVVLLVNEVGEKHTEITFLGLCTARICCLAWPCFDRKLLEI